MRPLLLLILLFYTFILEAQSTHTISGYIQDMASGEALISCNVYDSDTFEGTSTNNYGFFSLTLPAGHKKITCSYIGYESVELDLRLRADTSLVIRMNTETTLDEVVVVAEKKRNIAEESQMSTVQVPIKQIKKIPPLLGEVDVLKALQLLPGVQSGGEGQSGLYVRGGSPDQNLILLDGVPVYNASHLFGFFSVFNADAIKDVKLIKGGFPARYGGRLSSVLEINLKEGNMKEIKGAGSIGLISSKLTLEGPIKKDQTSFLISGRRTYADLIARPFIAKEYAKSNKSGGSGIYFYDFNAKVNHIISDRDKLFLSFYGGTDRFYFDEKEKSGNIRDYSENALGWGNITSALRWNRVWNPKLFSNTSLTYSKYDLDTRVKIGSEIPSADLREEILLGYDSGINDVALKLDFDYLPNPKHYLKFGISGIHHKFNPGVFTLKEENINGEVLTDETLGQEIVTSQELDAYIEDDVQLTSALKANVGIHLSGFNVRGKFYGSVQPRLSMRYLLSDRQSFKFSFATMRQYVQLLSFNGIGLPTDLWVPTTDRIKAQNSWQIAAGYSRKLNDSWDLTIEGYYKQMNNLLNYKEGEGLFGLNDWQDRVIQGEGRSYGAEIFLQKKAGRFNGWLGYTWSKTDRQFDELNEGNRFPYRFDRRHDISVVGQYELNPRVNFSATWVYGTGNAVSLPESTYGALRRGQSITNVNQIEELNNFRMSAYHRFDIGINFNKKTKWGHRTWSIGAYNAYNNKNPFYIYLDNDYEYDTTTGQGTVDRNLKQQSLFPIIPYFNYSFNF